MNHCTWLKSYFSPIRRLVYTKVIAVLGLLSALAVAPRLFLNHPILGPIPVSAAIPVPPPGLDLMILLVLAGLLVPVLFLSNPRLLILTWCAVFFARCVWDRMTWQPYLLQYFFMIFSMAFAARLDRHGNGERCSAVLNTNRLILVCIYFWSGLSKLNHTNMILEPRHLLAPFVDDRLIPALSVFWWFIPLFEIGFALGLLTQRLRRISMWAAISMHVLILIIYGPFGYAYNPVIWPWNVAMICLLVVLFRRDRSTRPRKILWVRRFALHQVVLIVFVLCPLLSYVGLWSPYLSFRLYSHLYHHGAMLIQRSITEQLPITIREHLEPCAIEGFDNILHLSHWGERQLNAFPPTDLPVLRHMARRICALSNTPGAMKFMIIHPPNVMTGQGKREILCCGDLGS